MTAQVFRLSVDVDYRVQLLCEDQIIESIEVMRGIIHKSIAEHLNEEPASTPPLISIVSLAKHLKALQPRLNKYAKQYMAEGVTVELDYNPPDTVTFMIGLEPHKQHLSAQRH